jgi:PmbA protein
MTDKELLKIAAAAADAAKSSGAQQARAKTSRSREIVVEWRDGQLDRIRESTKLGLSVDLYVDGRYTSNSTSDLRPAAIGEWIGKSVEATRYLAVDEHRHLPDPSSYSQASPEPLQIFDPSIASVSPDQRLSVAKAIENASSMAVDSQEIVSVTSTVGDYEYTSTCVCTNGQEATEHGTYFDVSAQVSVKDEGDRKPSDYAYGSTRFASDLPDTVMLGAEATSRAVNQIGSKQAPTGDYDLVIENRSVPDFARHLLSPLAGNAVQQKRSFLADKLGQPLFSELLTITDDPTLLRGLSSTTWDSEGMAVVPRPVIEKGVVKSFFLDTYYASKLGMAPTSGGRTNLVWGTGTKGLDAIVASIDRGILVKSFLGGNSNSTTGDFSLGIKGFLVEKGKIVHPVSEMNIAGNHLTFWKKLVAVGSDPWPHSSNRAPTLHFSGVQCSGA